MSATHRPHRRASRYPSDTNDEQWELIDRLLPDPPWSAGRGGRPEAHRRRQVVDAVLHVLDNGVKWRALPADFPPWSTVYRRFAAWADDIADPTAALRDRVRLAADRTAAPSAAVVDSQSVRAAETVGHESRGRDHAKKANGRKRHIAVDTLGLLLAVLVTPASRQDHVAAVHLLRRAHTASPHLRHLSADGAYTGTFTTTAQEQHGVTVEIVQRPDTAKGFTVLPRRWVVERTLALITRHRRRARDHERHPAHHTAFVHWAAIRLMSLHLTR